MIEDLRKYPFEYQLDVGDYSIYTKIAKILDLGIIKFLIIAAINDLNTNNAVKHRIGTIYFKTKEDRNLFKLLMA